MSDSNTSNNVEPEKTADAKNPTDHSATDSATDAGGAASQPNPFDDIRRKLVAQVMDWTKDVDGLQDKLANAAAQAKTVIEKELGSIKSHHPQAFAQINDLRAASDEGWAVLRTHLDKVAHDLEKAVGTFLESVGASVKKAVASPPPGMGNKADAASPSAETDAPSSDAPKAETDDKTQP